MSGARPFRDRPGAPAVAPRADSAPPLRFETLRASAGGRELHVFPGHDGILAGIARMAGMLEVDIAVRALTLDGLDPEADIEHHAQACADAIRRSSPAGPYRLAGLCFGGCLAFEVAKRLEAGGAQVALLALIDALAPDWAPEQPALVRRLAQARQWRHKLAYHLPRVATLGPRAGASYLAGRVQVSRAFRRERSAFIDAMDRYRPEARRGDVLLLRLKGRRLDAPDLGWRDRVDGRLDVVDLPFDPGGALGRHSAPRVAAVLDARLRAPVGGVPA
jgi:phthiocerol/phenolphthiocerol synthesis type-I polyketide synthase D